ncbi:hypothetical protein F0919_14485 [Taibaiella lutea]|uniref:Uncharacterized protein n=1 Tax=Taibaiella lutea TaxID=2608001 RepID=A0A5M6CFB5_9BACT|nr:hypothetical protein [Taibaiella lutea]KAA5533736.1 hypothetical protein F0919_14485 [Taibaiella lutea]
MKQVLTPIVETIIRITSKSPKYFQALQIVLVAIAALLGIIRKTEDMIHYPAFIIQLAGESGFLSVLVGLFISLLPTNNTNATKAKVDSILNK